MAAGKQQAASVCIGRTETEDKEALLGTVLEESGFWDVIEGRTEVLKRKPADFAVALKPDLDCYDFHGPTGTDPELVEHLIELLHRRGFERVTVVDGLGASDLWLENRDVPVLADLVGYRFETAAGGPYDICSLSEDLVDAGFPSSSPLQGTGIGRAWREADFRIVFGKNKTDEEYRFALNLHCLLGVLPLRAREYHYRGRLRPEHLAVDLIRALPVDFALVDAFRSNHGSQGSRAANPLETRTILAGNDLLLADWVGALKMNLDPYGSVINGHALREIGLPKNYRIHGPLDPYPGWKNVSPLMVESARRRNRSLVVRQMVLPWLQSVNKELFPFKRVGDERVNAALAPLVAEIDGHPAAYYGLLALNFILGNTQNLLDAWHVLFEKDRVPRREVPLGIDLDGLTDADFESISDYILPLARLAGHTAPDENGLRWRYIDESVLFEFSRILPVPYDDFVGRVDIARSVQFMYDNIGGARVPLVRDSEGRVVRQAERDLYLPQPNWMILFGGKYIDVGKIESIDYAPDRQRICWRTVTSANQSAEYDDGVVTFERDPGGTRITIVARQKFALPLFWQAFPLDQLPQFKDSLVSNSYVRFFSRTIANFEAAFEGRDPRLGKAWDSEFGEGDGDVVAIPVQQIQELLELFSGTVRRWMGGAARDPVAEVDEFGYRHHRPTPDQDDPLTDTVKGFMSDLGGAIRKDARLFRTLANPESR